jgi:hypothetical protein
MKAAIARNDPVAATSGGYVADRRLLLRRPANDMNVTSMLLERHECHILVVTEDGHSVTAVVFGSGVSTGVSIRGWRGPPAIGVLQHDAGVTDSA